MAGRLENQMWCAGLEVQQQPAGVAASDRIIHQHQELDEPSIKCSSDTSGALYPVRNSSNSSTASSSVYYSSSSSSSGGGGGGVGSTNKYLQTPSGEYAPRLVGTYPTTGQPQWASMDGTESPQHRGGDYAPPHHQFSMSGGPPQHPHGRQAPPNSAWNHLQVPNFYPARQPQHAHMSSELPLLATPTWHTPTTTEPSKAALSHSPLFNLQQMLGSERPYARHSPGVDLTLTRNGSSSQNGDLPQTPISLSVRDTKQINSLPVGAALDGDRAVELTKGASPDCQPSPKNMRRPAAKRMDSIIDRLNTTSEKQQQQQLQQLQLPAAVQSVIVTAASSSHDENSNSSQGTAIASAPTPTPMLVRDDDVSSPVSNEDSLDSNKSRRKRKPSKTMKVATKEDDLLIITPPVEIEKVPPAPLGLTCVEPVPQALTVPPCALPPAPAVVKPSPARRRSSSEPPVSPTSASKSRRKTVSESETIDNIAAMVAATKAEPLVVPSVVVPLPPAVEPVPKEQPPVVPSLVPAVVNSAAELTCSSVTSVGAEQPLESPPPPLQQQPVATPVSVITRDHSNCSSDTALNQTSAAATGPVTNQELPIQCNTATPSDSQTKPPEPAADASGAPKKADETECFVAVEDELEKMFAGIADSGLQSANDPLAIASTSQSLLLDNVTSTSSEVASGSGTTKSNSTHKRGRPKGSKNSSRRASESNSTDSTPRKKHKASKKYEDLDEVSAKLSLQSTSKKKSKKSAAAAAAAAAGGVGKLQLNNKPDVVKDVYSYDSGSNASSSRSKGPFIQIKGPRDSPISVSIVNTPCHEDDPDKPGKQLKNKKFHDDSEYRHKVRSKGLHCSTLSNKYDAQTRDATWICVFCKRGPHATDPDLPGPSQFTLDTPQYSPGDLFGPYIITTDCAEYHRRSEDPFDTQFKSKKSAQMSSAVLQCAVSPGHGKKSKKRQNSESSLRDSVDSAADVNTRDVMFGIAEVTPTSYEVWAHEDCVIWGPGVYLVGPKIMGLEGAVWGACSVPCRRCGLRGAAVCCLTRGCGSVMHIGCAKLSHWQLDELNYKAHCTEHSTHH